MTTKLGELDTTELPDVDAREIEELIRSADVPALEEASPMRGEGADRFQYDLVIEDDKGRRELTMSEDKVPNELRPLIDRLRAQKN